MKEVLKTLLGCIVITAIFAVYSYYAREYNIKRGMEKAVIGSFANNGINIDGYILKCEFKEDDKAS